MHPDRPKLADILASELRKGISGRKWTNWLPQERVLAEELKVSRSTLRQALNRLAADGLIDRLHSKGSRILPRRVRKASKASQSLTVNLVVPGMSRGVRPAAAQWVEELQAQLAGRGGRLRILTAKACYTNRPERALAELMCRNPADCWIFRLSNAAMQRWLSQQPTPVIVAGTCHPGVELPFLDIDHRAMSRHATSAIIAAGHRRIALLVDRDRKAGDLESERGFAEAIATSKHSGVEPTVARYPEGVQGLLHQIDQLLCSVRPPTAILITQAIYCLTIWSYLGSKGLRIPTDLSVVAQVGGLDLLYLVPEPTFYLVNRRTYVQKILRLIDSKISGSQLPRENLVIPEFSRGKSLGFRRANGE